MADSVDNGTELEGSTVDDAALRFEAYLSALEDGEARETPPTPEKSPAASESDEAEASTEQADAEDAPAEADEQPEAEDEAPESDDSLDPNLKVRVKIDGVDTEVTLEEALKGYSRQADYTRKTQELAGQRKAQEAEFQAVRGERQQYAHLISQLEQALQEATPQEPDWAKVQAERPDDFPHLWAQWQQRQSELTAVAQERQRAQQAVERDNALAKQQRMESEHAKLVEAIPAWKDAAVAKAEKAELVAYAEKVGFTREELGQVEDHRPLLLLHKAMLFDKAQAAKPAIKQRIEKVKAATPGPTPKPKVAVSDLTRARQRLAKTGSVEDAAVGFALMLGDD